MQSTLSDAEFAQFRAFAAGAEILHAEIDVAGAEILLLNTVVKELVATPGTKFVHEFISAVLILDHDGGSDYATHGDLIVRENSTSGTILSDTIAAADLVQASAGRIRTMQVLSATAVLLPGSSMVLFCDTGAPTAGTSPIRVKVAYRTHATGL